MLIYHPAYDAYHCTFRLMVAMESIGKIELQKLRIIDFFLAFPAEIRNIRLPQSFKKQRKIATELVNIYHGPISMNQVFRDMEQIQFTAVHALAAANLIKKIDDSNEFILRTSRQLPEEITRSFWEFKEKNKEILNFILTDLVNFPLHGIDGLKHRTGLMEYRYDNA